MVDTLTQAEKAFMLKTVKLMIKEGQVSSGRQLILRYIGNSVFTDEELAELDRLTEEYESEKEEEEE